MKQNGLFKKERRKRRVMAHITDCCEFDNAYYECKKCGWKSGWVPDEGDKIPCPKCNKEKK